MITKKKMTGIFAGLLILALSQSAVAANGTLLGVQLDYPRISFTEGAPAQGAVYDGTDLTITATVTFITFTNGGTAEFTSGGSLTLTAPIDGGGVLGGGGTYSISGTVTDTATATVYSGTLLSGAVSDYGIVDTGGPGGTDLSDFALTVTGGSMSSLVGGTLNMVVTLEGSSYAGGFTSAWSAARAKGDAGPPPDVETQPPHTIGYWKNHPEAWPVSSLTICGNSLTQGDAIGVLAVPPRGDVTIIMAKQLIAAMLNVAVGNSCPLIPSAEAWLCSHGGIGASVKQWDGGEELKNALDEFNNGTGNCTL
jgi:hypothetical protein